MSAVSSPDHDHRRPAAQPSDLRTVAADIVGTARWAPSLHNAQPWAFRVGTDTVDVLLDRARQLPVSDPLGRQATIGLGAAVRLVELTLSTMDNEVRVERWPLPADPALVARVRVVAHRIAPEPDRQLLAAVPARRTVRTPFGPENVPVPLRVAWREAVEAAGADLRWVEGVGERIGVAALVAAAERLQQRDPAFLAELDRWTSPEATDEGAGVPPGAFGMTAAAGHSAEFPMRDFAGAYGNDVPQRHVGPVEPHPVVAVLHTAGDRPEDWLEAGRALMGLLLAAAADGYAASYLNQPLELPGLRQQVRDELRLAGWPQLMLRIGRPHGVLPPRASRRPITDLLLPFPSGAVR
jgi:nitroreductase